MAEIKIEVIEIDKYKVHVPVELKDSKVAEKFVTAYFDAYQKIIVEQAKAMQLRHQNDCDVEKQKRRYRYWFGIFMFVVIVVAIKFPIKN